MVAEMKYVDLNHALYHLKIQVIDSIPFACNMCPDYSGDLPGLFRWLKSWTKYKLDPNNTELFQTMQTLWANNGEGDCDCFVITTLACLWVCGFRNIQVALVGRDKRNAVHIYTICNGKVLDLTNREFDQERPYPYKQLLTFKLN